MGKENKSYRIRTNVDKDSVVNFSVDNTIDTLEILSLKIDQKNTYRLMGSNTGVIVGRVLANGGFGVPNVKVSVFIEYEDTDDISQRILYHFGSTKELDDNGIRYNLLPNELDDECHQNIGTFPSKRVLLDNNNWIEVFDKYYKFTTRTNDSGDYMIYGVPTGNQTVHIDVDLSDIGILSQRPRDLIYKGYNANMFESMTKFKVDTNIDSLAQVITQDQAIYVYPFWGDTTDSDLNESITRCDLQINYKFEPTCIFMGSVITDAGENAMTQKCIGGKNQGRMDEMITGEGRIEMIRKTPNGQIEQFSVKGDANINSDGVWCYQIPMNLDYVKTDEFGKMVMSDDPSTGLPTRARVRFRLSMAETPSDATARKRARYLIPNNPRLVETDYPSFCENMEIDYEFGTKTKDENFRDLMWNNVYTVKSYIPRLQKSRLPNSLRHLGIKMVNHPGSNNPMPFNNLRIKFNFVYMFLCTLVKVLVTIVGAINKVLTSISYIFYQIGSFCFSVSKDLPVEIAGKNYLTGPAKLFAEYNGKCMADISGVSYSDFLSYVRYDPDRTSGIGSGFCKIFLAIGCGIQLSGLCETDDGTPINVTPGTNQNTKVVLQNTCGISCNNRVDLLYNCVENQLAQENEVTSFNFYNDWVNGVVYLPLWYRKIKKRRNGTIKKDKWCSTDNTMLPVRSYKKNLRLYSTMTPTRVIKSFNSNSMGKINPLANNESTVHAAGDNESGAEVITFTKYNEDNCYGYQCHKYSRAYFKVYKGLVFEKETMLGDKVYYYKPCDYDKTTGNTDLVTLFATDLVLLGSLNECDMHGIPQFFKALESTTYNMPPDLLSETYDYINEDVQTRSDEDDDSEIDLGSRITEYTGADWGNLGADQSNYKSTVISFGNVSYSVDANENIYDNGGLFYGLTCFNSYTKPKSCINLSRICEFGVSLDETQELPNSDSSNSDDDANLTPDGFVSYDEIYNPDYRSMFATLNANFLKTKLNPETGLLEYDFNHMYVDNFDGSLQLLMQANSVNGNTEKSDFQTKANYIGNYQLEESSDAYLNFRYGKYMKRSGNYIYYYDANKTAGIGPGGQIPVKNKIPRYENSFYFYFGLNEGKTAIDKFNNEFFSDCKNKFASDVPYEMEYRGNSWCPVTARDGFIALNVNVDAPLSITFTDKNTNDIYYQKSINKQKVIFCGTDELPEGYENYTKYKLFVKQSDDLNSNINQIDILPSGTYKIELTDAYDNIYTDSITFELPRIGFVCDVNPFNCKNSDLIGRFSGSDIKDTYTNIANYVNYELYKENDIIEAGNVYYENNGSTYIQHNTNVDIIVQSGDNFYYKDRDIRGFVSISNITEGRFKIKLEPLDTNFFGSNYIGCEIYVNVTEATESTPISVNVIEPSGSDECGYLGYKITNGIVSYWFGVPYANKRYRFTITQMCEEPNNPWVESYNKAIINVIVYEDEFKLYINDIDYDIISAFKSGWNDMLLENGEFLTQGRTATSYNEDNIYGWNDILNIGKYEFEHAEHPIEKLGYMGEPIGKVIGICESLSSGYANNGNSSVPGTTPYKWINEYCYDAPSTNSNYYYKGTVQQGKYTYEIPYRINIKDNRVIYDINGNVLEESDMVYVPNYRKYNSFGIIYNNEIYYKKSNDTYIQHVNKTGRPIIIFGETEDYYYSVNQITYYLIKEGVDGLFIKYETGDIIDSNGIYYTKSNNDYILNVNHENAITVTDSNEYYYIVNENNIAKEGRDYVAMNYVFDENGDTIIAKDPDEIPIDSQDTYSQPREIELGETYYKDHEHTVVAVLNVDYLEDIEYTTHDVVRIDSYDSENGYIAKYKLQYGYTVVANEDNDGNITYTSATKVTYSDLVCLTFIEYRAFIDAVNEVIDNRSEFTRTVAGAFRINHDETILTLTAQTKAKPVRYLIAGNSEITTVEDLYSYRPGQEIPNIEEVTQEIENGISQIRYIDKGYVVDEYFETPEEIFKIPTLTYGEYDFTYICKNFDNDTQLVVGDVYYTSTTSHQYIEWRLTAEDITRFGGSGATYVTPAQIFSGINDNVYLKELISGFIPYALTTQKQDNIQKHPYYVSIINDNAAIMPSGKDLSNFDGPGQNKNLETTFPVHFYNKPLKCELPIIMSFINSIPAYPEIQLGEITDLGYLSIINGFKYKTKEFANYDLINKSEVNTVDNSTSFLKYSSDEAYQRFIVYFQSGSIDNHYSSSISGIYTKDIKKIIQQSSQLSQTYDDEIYNIELRRVRRGSSKVLYPGDVYYAESTTGSSDRIPGNIGYYLIPSGILWYPNWKYWTYEGNQYVQHQNSNYFQIPENNNTYYFQYTDYYNYTPLIKTTYRTFKLVNTEVTTAGAIYENLISRGYNAMYLPDTEVNGTAIYTVPKINPNYVKYNVGAEIYKNNIFNINDITTFVSTHTATETLVVDVDDTYYKYESGVRVPYVEGNIINIEDDYYAYYRECVADRNIRVDVSDTYYYRNETREFVAYNIDDTIGVGDTYYTYPKKHVADTDITVTESDEYYFYDSATHSYIKYESGSVIHAGGIYYDAPFTHTTSWQITVDISDTYYYYDSSTSSYIPYTVGQQILPLTTYYTYFEEHTADSAILVEDSDTYYRRVTHIGAFTAYTVGNEINKNKKYYLNNTVSVMYKAKATDEIVVTASDNFYYIDRNYPYYIEHIVDEDVDTGYITVTANDKYFYYNEIIRSFVSYIVGDKISEGTTYYTLENDTGVTYSNRVEYYYPEGADFSIAYDADRYLAKVVYNTSGQIKSVEYHNGGNYRYSVPTGITKKEVSLGYRFYTGGTNYRKFIYKYKNGSSSHLYYGKSINSTELLEAWRPINVFMPGFMCGYLYNGIPKDEEKSNIKATLNETDITFDTINEDVYSNINVKRLIYTDYDGNNEQPRYGMYKLDSDSSKKYQYAEVPLIDDDLVYTDGYGDEYRRPIIGTLAVMADYPIFMFKNNLDGDDTMAKEDYLMTKSHYTNDNGYTQYQTTYYIYDLDKTEYPLSYCNVVGYESNLRYNTNTNKFYFKEMPELLLNPDDDKFECISKSNSIQFNVSGYVRNKWGTDHLNYKYPKEKFFVLASVNNQISISPVLENQIPRIIYNYNGFDFNDNDHNYLYLTAREKRDFSDIPEIGETPINSYPHAPNPTNQTARDGLAHKTGRHYVEDFYYLNNYRFVIHLATFDTTKGIFNPDVYTQVYSVMEGTAEHCYIKVVTDDGSGKRDDYTYVASAIRFRISPLGSYITLPPSPDSSVGKLTTKIDRQYTFIVEDITNVMRSCTGHETVANYHTQVIPITEEEFKDWDNRDSMWYSATQNYRPDGWDGNRYYVKNVW